jgi:hypothetical protein
MLSSDPAGVTRYRFAEGNHGQGRNPVTYNCPRGGRFLFCWLWACRQAENG